MTNIEKIATAIFALSFLAVIGMAGSDTACANIGKLITGVLVCIPIMAVSAAVIAHEERRD